MYSLKAGYSLDPHQVVASEFIDSRPSGGALAWLETGLGKGFVGAVKLMDWLNTPGISRALVTCPAGLVEDWRFKLDLYAGIKASVWDEGDLDTPIQLISHTLLQEPKKNSKVARRNRVPEIIAWKPQVVIADEHHKFKSYSASQTKGLMKIMSHCSPKHRLGMTATPTTTIDPEELRPQLLFADSMLLQSYGVDDWMRFRRKFCEIEKGFFGGMTIDKVVGVKKQGEKLLDEIIGKIAIKQTAELLNLPDQVFEPVYYSMPPRSKKLYRKMAVEGAILEKNLEVTTANALGRSLRCFEIRSGFVTDFDKQVHDLDDTLVSTVVELVRNTPRPLLVVYKYRHTGDQLEAALAKERWRIGHIRGGVDSREKSAIEQRFQAGGLDVVLGQYAAVSLGLTFTRGNQIIFAEPTFSLEEWIQTLGRIRRRGQTQTCFYHMLIESSAGDQDCYDSLQNKEDFAEKISRGAARLLSSAPM